MRALIFGLCCMVQFVHVDRGHADTLADVQSDIAALRTDLEGARLQLLGSQSQRTPSLTRSLLETIHTIEQELNRLTHTTEELQFQTEQALRESTARLSRLEARLCDMTPDCTIPEATSTAFAPATLGQPVNAIAGSLDNASFDAATQAFAANDLHTAQMYIDVFLDSTPNGPLTQAALLLKGETLRGLGAQKKAARVLLAAYTYDPRGPEAPKALLGVGRALGALGKTAAACVVLDEVGMRFAGSAVHDAAQQAKAAQDCAPTSPAVDVIPVPAQ